MGTTDAHSRGAISIDAGSSRVRCCTRQFTTRSSWCSSSRRKENCSCSATFTGTPDERTSLCTGATGPSPKTQGCSHSSWVRSIHSLSTQIQGSATRKAKSRRQEWPCSMNWVETQTSTRWKVRSAATTRALSHASTSQLRTSSRQVSTSAGLY